MKFLTPSYYAEFTCKADKCTDNCCIGWEICIDSETQEKYKNTGGALGKRLRDNISYSEEPSFILKGERCPFLNEKGLCDIIIEKGKDYLCQICRDHPRFFEWYGSVKEGGIGLSCEEGARLIFSRSDYRKLTVSEVDEWIDEDYPQNVYNFLFACRERIFDLTDENNSLSFIKKAGFLREYAKECEEAVSKGGKVPIFPLEVKEAFSLEKELSKAIAFLSKTEAVNEKWIAEFERLKAAFNKDKSIFTFASSKEEKYFSRLLSYFIWRYFMKASFDFEVSKKAELAIFSTISVFAFYKLKEEGADSLISCAVLFSKQLEYSEENIELFYTGG